MITHRAIAKRFKAGESVEHIADSLSRKKSLRYFAKMYKYIEHAIRQVMRKQRWQP